MTETEYEMRGALRAFYYFAYGVNMSSNHVSGLCTGARRISAAVLDDHRFRINSAGWATVVREQGSRVHGTLWRVDQACFEALDAFEGVPEGLYRRQTLEIDSPIGRTTAEIYLATFTEAGRPDPRYIDAIIRAATENDLPGSYLHELESWR